MPNCLTPDVQAVALNLMEGLDCARSLTVAILIRHRAWDELTSLEALPMHYLTADDYFAAAAATDFLRKYSGFKLDIDPAAAAIDKWWWAERECYRTNERLSPLLYGGSHGSVYSTALGEFVSLLRKKTMELVGSGPPERYDLRFGPGATMSDSSQFCTVPDKMSSVPTLTPNVHLPIIVSWTETWWAGACAELGKIPSLVRGNAFFTVPKTARTMRACAKEPSINGAFQLGLGRVLRKRLGRAGFDLVNGQDVHRRVACIASKEQSDDDYDNLVTIDLSSASDTVCYNLVKLCMPHGWFIELNALRSPFTKVKGRWVKLEKFSSMGNGYTFELETTLFAAICMAVMGDRAKPGINLFVYGDDIIVPKACSKDVIAALKFFGFTPNMKKTFLEGPFRESCGGDFFDGVSVRPHYLTEDPNEPQQIISLANGIRRLAVQYSHNPSRSANLRRAWFSCLDLLPSSIRRCRGPEALGDIVIHDAEDRWDFRWRANGIRYIRVYRPAKYRKVRWEGFAYTVQFAAALYGVALNPRDMRCSEGYDRRWLVPRDGVTGYKVGWVPYS